MQFQVLFAINASAHFYIVSYDLLFGTWDIIDNSAVRVNHKAKYGGWVDVLVSYFN